jgi:radical SAM superfamily enzyme YgiQ (UPF0313 family)
MDKLLTRKVSSIQLFSVPSNFGRGANDGAYYPLNLIVLASYIRKSILDASVSVIDLFHDPFFTPDADIVGISASSTLNYQNVLALSRKAKEHGSIVVIGGAHVLHLADQILKNQSDIIDFVIRGNGEESLVALISAIKERSGFSEIPGLSWLDPVSGIRHNPIGSNSWDYEKYLPFDLSLLHGGIERYWKTFRDRIDPTIDATFLVFSHFGCGYYNSRYLKTPRHNSLTSWCSYCSLSSPVIRRSGKSIVHEVLDLIKRCNMPKHSKILLKCYGDNVGTQITMLEELANVIDQTREWNDYNIGWTFYCQSCRITERLLELLFRVGAWNLFIGFDSADDNIQRLNGLGTSMNAHRRAVALMKKYGIKIQAGFVLGCAGETLKSLNMTISFAQELATSGTLERTNAAILFIVPGAPAYNLLCEREPWIREMDSFPTRSIQLLWLKYFCPNLGRTPEEALSILEVAANRIDQMSPGPHASMGFLSRNLSVEMMETTEK